MISVKTLSKPSLTLLRQRNYADFKRVLELYDKWDVAAKEKDFHNAEHYDYQIQKIHRENGIAES